MEALQFVRSLVSDPRALTEADVRDIHKLVVGRTQRAEAGQYSTFQRQISGSLVSLPAPEKIAPLMRAFGEWLGQANSSPEHAIQAHFDLVTIHPFSDGNGRTARLLMNLLLLRGGYPPIVVHPVDRPDYIDAIEQAQLNEEPAGFVILMLKLLRASFEKYFEFLREEEGSKSSE